jgi:hypothetical protein
MAPDMSPAASKMVFLMLAMELPLREWRGQRRRTDPKPRDPDTECRAEVCYGDAEADLTDWAKVRDRTQFNRGK